MKFPRLFQMLIMLLLTISSAAQHKNAGLIFDSTRGKFTMQLLCSTDSKAFILNIVGGGLKYTKGSYSVALVLFPSLRFGKQPPGPGSKLTVTPIFAAGPLFQYKELLIGCPIYYGLDSKWHFSFGIGIKAGR